MKLIELEEVDSTNDYLKREYQNLPMQTCVTAKYLSLIHISEPTRLNGVSRMPSSA